jgi:hypothetical protein
MSERTTSEIIADLRVPFEACFQAGTPALMAEAAARLEKVCEDRDSGNDCLALIRETLRGLGIDSDNTAAMFLNDMIRGAITRRDKAIMELEAENARLKLLAGTERIINIVTGNP